MCIERDLIIYYYCRINEHIGNVLFAFKGKNEKRTKRSRWKQYGCLREAVTNHSIIVDEYDKHDDDDPRVARVSKSNYVHGRCSSSCVQLHKVRPLITRGVYSKIMFYVYYP